MVKHKYAAAYLSTLYLVYMSTVRLMVKDDRLWPSFGGNQVRKTVGTRSNWTGGLALLRIRTGSVSEWYRKLVCVSLLLGNFELVNH